MKRFVLPSKSASARRATTNKQQPAAGHRLGLRMFRPPLRAVVHTNHGWPAEISAWGKQRSVYGKVVQLAGPWRTTGDWWGEDCWARDEWDVAVVPSNKASSEPPGLYRIYRKLNSEMWFVEGNYD